MSASKLVACQECDLLHGPTPLPPGGEAPGVMCDTGAAPILVADPSIARA